MVHNDVSAGDGAWRTSERGWLAMRGRAATGNGDGGRVPASRRRALIGVIVASSAVVICVVAILVVLVGRNASSRALAEERYQTCSRIEGDVDEIIAPYVNDEGVFAEYDAEALDRAACDVYAYAQGLRDAGTIRGCALCEEGDSVSFFLNDGMTYVYFPKIDGYYAGGGDFTVTTFENTSLIEGEKWAYRNPSDLIEGAVDGAHAQTYGNDTTVADLKEIFASWKGGGPRAVFWTGHGNVCADENGKLVFALILDEKKSPEKNQLYAADLVSHNGELKHLFCSDDTYAISASFVEDYMGDVDGGLFFAGSCLSAADTDQRFGNTLREKGFDAYVGTTGEVLVPYSNTVLSHTAEYLATLTDQGLYTDLRTALSDAERRTLLDGSFVTNMLTYGGQFTIVGDGDFRLVDPVLSVHVSTSAADRLDDVDIWCRMVGDDGVGGTPARFTYADLVNGTFDLPIKKLGSTYEIGFGKGATTLKVVTVDTGALTFSDNAASMDVALDVANLDIVVEDEDGGFVPDAEIAVTPKDDENGVLGLTQSAALAKNAAGEQVYRIPVCPGSFSIAASSDAFGEAERTVEVSGDTTVRFSRRNDPSAYADVVRQYEDTYGTFRVYDTAYGQTYTGVFLLDLVDFDQNGTDELVIGYSVPHPQGIEYCAWPALDVWELRDGVPERAYEGAMVQQSDIGRHCSYVSLDGTWYLVTGWEGSDVDLDLLSLRDGSFSTGMTLRAEEQGSGVYVYGMRYYLNDSEIGADEFGRLLDEVHSGRTYSGSVYESDSYSVQDMVDALNATRAEIGLDAVDPAS